MCGTVSFDRVVIDGDLTVRPFDAADQLALLGGRDEEFHGSLVRVRRSPAHCVHLRAKGNAVASAARHMASRTGRAADSPDSPGRSRC